MRQLKVYLLENETRVSMIQFIKDAIERVPDEELKEFYDWIKNNEDSKVINKEDIKSFFVKRGIEDIQAVLLRIIKDHFERNALYSIIKDPDNMISTKDFLGKSSNNIYNMFKKLFSLDCLKEMNALRVSKKGVNKGPYEIICSMCLKDAVYIDKNSGGYDKNNTGSADIILSTDNGLVTVEIKGWDARVKGMSTGSVNAIDNTFIKDVKDRLGFDIKCNRRGCFSSQEAVFDLFKQMQSHNATIDDVNRILSNCLLKQYDKLTDISKYEKQLYDFLTKHYMDYYPDIEDAGALKNKNELSNFVNLLGLTELFLYHAQENWTYIIIFGKEDNGEYIVIKGSEIDSIQQAYSTLKKPEYKNLSFTGFISNSTPYESAVKVRYKN